MNREMQSLNGMARLERNKKIIIGALGVALAVFVGIGCGGGGGDSSAPLLRGTFVDSPVEGLEYETQTQIGVTDTNGTFMYHQGETVSFHLGDIDLGEAPAKSMMTPVDLVEGAVDETHPMVTNMARLLQTMDADMDLENGITITNEMTEAMLGHMVDFNVDPDEFETRPDVVAFMETMNNLGFSGGFRMMVSPADAQAHLSITMADMMAGQGGMGSGNGMMGGNTM